jgi:hypothetical protein
MLHAGVIRAVAWTRVGVGPVPAFFRDFTP